MNAKERKQRSLYSDSGIYANPTYGGPFVSRGLRLAMSMTQGLLFPADKIESILVVGSGNGYELVHLSDCGYKVTGLEIYVPPVDRVRELTVVGDARSIPFFDKKFDLVFCTEMMEHVDPEDTKKILSECRRVAKQFFFSIATKMDVPYYTHINIKPAWWWLKTFEDLGFRIKHAQQGVEIWHLPRKGWIDRGISTNGVSIYGDC